MSPAARHRHRPRAGQPLVLGGTGQVGGELERLLDEVAATDRGALDLLDAAAIRETMRQRKPQVVINAAAYTAVDRAESEKETAMRVNGVAPGILGEEAR